MTTNSAFTKYNQFSSDLLSGAHNFSTHTFKLALTLRPPQLTDKIFTDIDEIYPFSGIGYTLGGATTTITLSTSGGIAKVKCSNVTWTETNTVGDSLHQILGIFGYAVLYNATQTSPLNPLIGYVDLKNPTYIVNGQTLEILFDQTNGVFTVQ